MTGYVALLRGVNLVGKSTLKTLLYGRAGSGRQGEVQTSIAVDRAERIMAVKP